MKVEFSIIIPNWNGEKFLRTCIESLKAQTFKNFEIIFVDDCSSDKSVDLIRKNYPEISIIKKKSNSGFPSSVNLGIKEAKGKFIALLNNDTEVDKNWLGEIVQASVEYPEASFFASKMLDFADRTIIDSCGDAMTWAGRSYKIGELEKDGAKFSRPKFVFGACAGAAVYKRDVFDTIGLFDEDFGFYLEDVDVDFRAQLAGFKCLFVPKAIVYHIGSATSGKKSSFSFKMMIKNHFHVIFKNFPSGKIMSNFFKLGYSEFRFFGAALKHHFVKEYFWGMSEAFKQFSIMKRKRKIIQTQIKIDAAKLDEVIDRNFSYKSLAKALTSK